jgi:Zn-dependent peptidase ImmA (M78 family)/transcriptional regulator with XRE-family HTH domain
MNAQVASTVLDSLDPRELGKRLQQARKARGQTQQQAADHVGIARTTITAIEQGERRIKPSELIQLASLYRLTVGEFVRRGERGEGFAIQLRGAVPPAGADSTEIERSIADFQRLCEDYLELERICGTPSVRRYPSPYEVGDVLPEAAAEDVADAERNRLGLGDAPILNLRELLESDVGLRIFYLDLPSRVAGMFAYTEQLGGCVAVNRKHPEERRRLSLGHEYGHFLTNRLTPEIAYLLRYERQPRLERFADALGRAFLMPSSGLRRRFYELQRRRGARITPADLCQLADLYFVSLEAMTRRLEELRLIPAGTWDRLHQDGARVQETRAVFGLRERRESDQLLPLRYRYLAVEAFGRGDLSEGQLARFLRTDRLDARRLAEQLSEPTTVSDDGGIGTMPLDLGRPLSESGHARDQAKTD